MSKILSEAKLDEVYPHVLALAFAGAYLYLNYKYPLYTLPKNLKDLLTASATINSIVVGFLATAKATLLSISGGRAIKWMKTGGQYQTLISYFMTAVHYSIVTAVVSALMLLFNFDKLPPFAAYFVCFWVFLSVGSLFSGYRIIRLYSTILRKS